MFYAFVHKYGPEMREEIMYMTAHELVYSVHNMRTENWG